MKQYLGREKKRRVNENEFMKAEMIHFQVYHNSKLASSLWQEIFQYSTKDSGLGHKTDLRSRQRVGDEAKRADEDSKLCRLEA